MKNFLQQYYNLTMSQQEYIAGKLGFKNDEYFYFIMTLDNNKGLFMEQALLANFLVDIGYLHMTTPLLNKYGDWITTYQGREYVVLYATYLSNNISSQESHSLAHFHEKNTIYPYEPQIASSYGKWKTLWIHKLTKYEELIKEEAQAYPTVFYDHVMDVFPYFIGLSENAIQYVQECEFEHRYHDVDQGTITFQRYRNQLSERVLWMNELFYDHPVRDIAEYIREKLLNIGEEGLKDCLTFLNEYTAVRPLSPFSYRMLIGRLLFPIHFFDFLEHVLMTKEPMKFYDQLLEVCEKQSLYEASIRNLFNQLTSEDKHLQIPMLQWL